MSTINIAINYFKSNPQSFNRFKHDSDSISQCCTSANAHTCAYFYAIVVVSSLIRVIICFLYLEHWVLLLFCFILLIMRLDNSQYLFSGTLVFSFEQYLHFIHTNINLLHNSFYNSLFHEHSVDIFIFVSLCTCYSQAFIKFRCTWFSLKYKWRTNQVINLRFMKEWFIRWC